MQENSPSEIAADLRIVLACLQAGITPAAAMKAAAPEAIRALKEFAAGWEIQHGDEDRISSFGRRSLLSAG